MSAPHRPHSRRLAAVGAAVVGDQRLRQPQRAAAAASNGGIVELEQGAADSVVTAVIDGSPFVTYCYGSDLSRPFLFPLRGPNGGPVITRPHQPDDGEHPHQCAAAAATLSPHYCLTLAAAHSLTDRKRNWLAACRRKGVWCAVDEVNGIRFWGERQIPDNVERWPQGKIESRGVVLRGGGTAAATLELSSEWLGEGGTAVLHEHTVLTIHASHLLEYTVTLTAPEDRDVIFGDTKEGFFGIRLVDELRASEGATVVNSDGVVGCDACYGRHADWIDYSGPVGSVQGDLRASRAVQDLTSDWQPVT